jgi:TatD DNase family protein
VFGEVENGKNGLNSQMILTDTHAHLYSTKFDNDRKEMVQRAFDAGVERIFLPAIDSETHDSQDELTAAFPGKIFSMMGLHPCSVQPETIKREIEIIKNKLYSGNYIAVGEIGIDLYWDKSHAELQKEIFALHIDWALDLNLPIAIHSRNAFNECYDIVRSKQNGNLRGVFHCFSDTPAEAQKVIDVGFFLGIGGTVTFKNSGIDKVIEAVQLEYVVLETDAPYLAPVPHRGQRNESSYIVHVAQKIADIKQIAIEEVARITTENSKRLFKI